MTPDEVVVLARYVRALCPQQRFDEYTPDAWHDVLGDHTLAAARQAAATVARRQPWVSPAEIITEIQQRRSAAAGSIIGAGQPAEIPDADPDDVPAYLAALREQRTRAADGQQLQHRPVAELLAATGQTVPDPHDAADTVRRAGPLGQHCPTCLAPVGRPCRTGPGAGRERRGPHPVRAEAAARAAAGLPTEDLADRQAAIVAEQERRRAVSLRALAALPPGTVIEPADGFRDVRQAGETP